MQSPAILTDETARHAGDTAAVCAYCELPLAGASPDGTDAGDVYCCLGCRVAAAVTNERGDEGESHWMAASLGVGVFLTMNVVMLTMALWSYTSAQTPFELALADFLRWGALAFSAPVWLLLGRPLALEAASHARRGVLSTDVLLLTGVAAANGFSIASTWTGSGHVYYEVGCVILVLVTLGRWMEARGRRQATQALDDMERLLPDEVVVIGDDGSERMEPRSAIRAGVRIRVPAGQRVPIDGTVESPRAVVDEQFLTGESIPVEKRCGESVLGGSLNLDGDVRVLASSDAQSGALGRLVAAVRNARMTKGRYQKLADRWARVFFPIIATIAFGAIAWHGPRSGWDVALMHALSVVLIACPCALALATPLAVWSALHAAARRGIVFRSGDSLERLAAIASLRWDKTGTLTTGMPRTHRCLVARAEDLADLVHAASLLSSRSTHPFSQSIAAGLDDESIQFAAVDDGRRLSLTEAATQGALNGHESTNTQIDVTTVGGRGVSAGHGRLGLTAMGSERWMADCQLAMSDELTRQIHAADAGSLTFVFVGWRGEVRGCFSIEESPRLAAKETLAQCRAMGIDQAVLTGDRAQRAQWLTAEFDVPVFAQLSPEQKLAAIQDAKRRHGTVAMVGDGLNDAPALAAADVGISLGCGADVTRESADVCLVTNDVAGVPRALELARQSVRIIRQNLAWSFGYNGLGVACAAAGWLHPAMAAALMVVSSLFVLANSRRLDPEEEFAIDRRGEDGRDSSDESSSDPAAASAWSSRTGDCGDSSSEVTP